VSCRTIDLSTLLHRDICVFLQKTDASELQPLRLSILGKRLHVEVEDQVGEHELQSADCEETTRAICTNLSVHIHDMVINVPNDRNFHDSPSMPPQPKGQIPLRNLHGADLPFARSSHCFLLVVSSMHLARFGSHLTIPKRPILTPILPFPRPL
jgi:hypothetical protein